MKETSYIRLLFQKGYLAFSKHKLPWKLLLRLKRIYVQSEKFDGPSYNGYWMNVYHGIEFSVARQALNVFVIAKPGFATSIPKIGFRF